MATADRPRRPLPSFPTQPQLAGVAATTRIRAARRATAIVKLGPPWTLTVPDLPP